MLNMSRICAALLVGSCILTNLIAPTHASAKKNIFKPPDQTDIADIKGTSTPWILDDLVPIINDFVNYVYEDANNSPELKAIYGVKVDSETSRDVFFRINNEALTDIGHPVPDALANIVSKSAALFDPLTMRTLLEANALTLAEFLLTQDIEVNRDTSHRYIDMLSEGLRKADLDNTEMILVAERDAFYNFAKSYNDEFKLIDVVDEYLELFCSNLIVLHDK